MTALFSPDSCPIDKSTAGTTTPYATSRSIVHIAAYLTINSMLKVTKAETRMHRQGPYLTYLVTLPYLTFHAF
jgi:hypothetical protein